MTDCARQYRADQEAAHRRVLARLRNEQIERTPEQRRGDVVVDEILSRGIERTRALPERDLQKLDQLWAQLEAEAVFALPREQERARLNDAALELIENDIDPELADQMLDGLRTLLGLPPQAVGEAIATARSAT